MLRRYSVGNLQNGLPPKSKTAARGGMPRRGFGGPQRHITSNSIRSLRDGSVDALWCLRLGSFLFWRDRKKKRRFYSGSLEAGCFLAASSPIKSWARTSVCEPMSGHASDREDLVYQTTIGSIDSSLGNRQAQLYSAETGMSKDTVDAATQPGISSIRGSTASNIVAKYSGAETDRGELGQEIENQKYDAERNNLKNRCRRESR